MKKLSILLAVSLFLTVSCNNSFGKKYWYGSTRRTSNGITLVTETYVSKKQKEMVKDAEEILNRIADKNISVQDDETHEAYTAFVALKNTEYQIYFPWHGDMGFVFVYEHVTSGKGWIPIHKSEAIYNFNSAMQEYKRQRDYYVRMLENE